MSRKQHQLSYPHVADIAVSMCNDVANLFSRHGQVHAEHLVTGLRNEKLECFYRAALVSG